MLFTQETSNLSPVTGRGFISKYAALLDILLRASDLVVVAATAWVVYALRFETLSIGQAYKVGILFAVLLTLLIFPAFGIYRSWRGAGFVAEIFRVWMAWICVFAAVLALNWMLKTTSLYSRVWMTFWFISGASLFALNRCAVRVLLGVIRAHGIDTRRVLVIGATQSARRICQAVERNTTTGLEVIGYISTKYDQSKMDKIPCLGTVHDLMSGFIQTKYEQLWIALPMRAEQSIREIMRFMGNMPMTIRLIPDLFGYELLNQQASEIANIPVITLQGSKVTGHARVLKAIEDRVIAFLILIMISPVMLLLAFGVKWSSPGPIFFKQKRHGLNGKEVEVWKFRSMKVHRETDGMVTQAKRNDERVTKFGKFIRSTSLDELPQFWNVLLGDMSIVGPRPHAVEHNYYYQKLVDGYVKRNYMKPGITGLAQINGCRGETDTIDKMRRRIDYDLLYIKNWSISLDLKIIFKTAIHVVLRTNAY